MTDCFPEVDGGFCNSELYCRESLWLLIDSLDSIEFGILKPFKFNTAVYFSLQSLENGPNGFRLVNVGETSLGTVTCRCRDTAQAPEDVCQWMLTAMVRALKGATACVEMVPYEVSHFLFFWYTGYTKTDRWNVEYLYCGINNIACKKNWFIVFWFHVLLTFMYFFFMLQVLYCKA